MIHAMIEVGDGAAGRAEEVEASWCSSTSLSLICKMGFVPTLPYNWEDSVSLMPKRGRAGREEGCEAVVGSGQGSTGVGGLGVGGRGRKPDGRRGTLAVPLPGSCWSPSHLSPCWRQIMGGQDGVAAAVSEWGVKQAW